MEYVSLLLAFRSVGNMLLMISGSQYINPAQVQAQQGK
jgi:hypothetical protein